ncbi:MAG: NUDIX hydrolase [Firmicutes bacterium]|nr:NUDIX hydrolase [Bacillota bacterium]
MKLLKEICQDPQVKCDKYGIRKTARAILLNDKNEILLLHARNGNWYELIGGGIDDGETLEQALHRECLEEAGAKIKVLGEVGVTLEFRNTQQRLKINHCYVAKILGELGATNMTDEEIRDDFVLEFHSLDKAIELLKSAKPFGEQELLGKFMIASELAFLEEYKKRAK